MTVLNVRGSMWRFGVVGMANTVVGLALIFCARALGLGEVSANAAGYALGLLCSFALNRRWTFRHCGPLLPNVLRFSIVVLAAWLLNIVTLLAFLSWGMPPALAQAAAVLPYTMASYCGCRWWVFANWTHRIKEGFT